MTELQNITKVFNSGSANEVMALSNVSITLQPQEFLVIVGSNGSGKSTLLNALAGNVSVSEGKILIDGNDITALKEHQRSKWVARIFQNPLMGTAPELTILENFRLAALRTQTKKLSIGIDEKFKRKVEEKISLLNLGLENKLDQPMGTLSGGQRQALTLIMSVMDEVKILLMDEPAAALDPKTSELLMQIADKIIREFHLTAILITHSMKDALTYGNRIIQMKEGAVIKDLNSKEKTTLTLPQLYSWFD